jgi:hypothetical protein
VTTGAISFEYCLTISCTYSVAKRRYSNKGNSSNSFDKKSSEIGHTINQGFVM